ncbi:hypothetical protein EON81_23040 [bacterium]|nr:MAG: hypothetical protein EON81_23040 [bacterium]
MVRLGDLGPEVAQMIREDVAGALPLYDPDSIGPDTYLRPVSSAEVLLDKDGETIHARPLGVPPGAKRREVSKEQIDEEVARYRSAPLRYRPMPKGREAAVQEAMKADAKAPEAGYSIRFLDVFDAGEPEAASYLRVAGQLWEEIVRDATRKVELRWAPQLAA